jgi:hypothetical protein
MRGNEIVYDTLFSKRANVDFGRLSLVIIITTLISAALFLIVRNLRLTFKLKPIPKPKPTFYILLGIIIIALSAFFLIKKYNSNLSWNKAKVSLDSTSTIVNSDTMIQVKKVKMIFPDSSIRDIEEADVAVAKTLGGKVYLKAGQTNNKVKKIKMIFPDGSSGDINEQDTLDAIEAGARRYDKNGSIVKPDFLVKNDEKECSEITALEKFKQHMKFYYPDYKIYGQPVIKQSDDCIYEVQFQTINPHEKFLNEKEVVIVKVNLRPPYFKYGTTTFETIRGELY